MRVASRGADASDYGHPPPSEDIQDAWHSASHIKDSVSGRMGGLETMSDENIFLVQTGEADCDGFLAGGHSRQKKI